jgi:hypothetical protein
MGLCRSEPVRHQARMHRAAKLIDCHAEFAIARRHNLIISAAAQGKRDHP